MYDKLTKMKYKNKLFLYFKINKKTYFNIFFTWDYVLNKKNHYIYNLNNNTITFVTQDNFVFLYFIYLFLTKKLFYSQINLSYLIQKMTLN